MQSNSEASDFSGVDFAGIRGLDPGGLYHVINVRNQEFIDHTFLGHVEFQETSLDVSTTGPSRVTHFGGNPLQQTNVIVDPGKLPTYVHNLSVKSNPGIGTNVIVEPKKEKQLATLTPISNNWEQCSSGKVIQTNLRQYSYIECPIDLPPVVVVPPDEKAKICSVQDVTEVKTIQKTVELCEEKTKELPHKKRLPRKKETLKSAKNSKIPVQSDNQTHEVVESNQRKLNTIFMCQLCNVQSIGQLPFYTHLRTHYEIRPEVKSIGIQVEEDLMLPEKPLQAEEKELIAEVSLEKHQVIVEEEFSDSEDMLEGIRNVVDKVQEQSGEDDSQTEHGGLEWYSQDSLNVPEGLEHHEANLQGVPENFVLYINKTDLEKINVENPIFTTQISEEVEEKLQQIEDKPTSNENIVDDSKKVPEDQEVVLKTRSGRKTRQCSPRILQESHIRMNLVKKKVKIGKTGKVPIGKEAKKRSHKKTLKCDVCAKELNSRNALKYHLLSHTGQRPHQCEVCGKAFYSSSALKVHKRLHSGIRPYACKHCNHQFRQWGDLKYHIASKHSDEKNHQCEFCGKDFARRYSLVIHRRIHTGEKNYACDYCSKTFRASSYLQNHRRIHTGEKPHPCTVCNKKFRVRGDMKRHMKIHCPKNDPKEKVVKKKRKKKDADNTESNTHPPQDLDNRIKMELNNATIEVRNESDEEASEQVKDETWLYNSIQNPTAKM